MLFRSRAISVQNRNVLDSRARHVASVALFKHPPTGHLSPRKHVSSNSSSRPPDTSLFVPLSVKSELTADASVGAELTQPLDKSMSLEL